MPNNENGVKYVTYRQALTMLFVDSVYKSVDLLYLSMEKVEDEVSNISAADVAAIKATVVEGGGT